MTPAETVKIFFLDELTYPAADEVTDDRDADSDNEHVESGAEDPTPGEDRPGGPNQEVGQHRNRERDDDGGSAVPDQEREDWNCGAEGGRETRQPTLLER